MAFPSKVKQWVTSQDGLDNLKLITDAIRMPGPHEVLVKISTVSINYRDTEVVMGKLPGFSQCLKDP